MRATRGTSAPAHYAHNETAAITRREGTNVSDWLGAAVRRLERAGRAVGNRRNRARWHRLHDTLPRSRDGRLMLHIGCGDIDAPGYVNVDARPLPHVHFTVTDLRDLGWVPDASVDMVYMCHVLEHVPKDEVGQVLKGLVRCLKPGGVLRLAVPDFDLLIATYQACGHSIKAIQSALMGGQDYPYNFHYAVFNEAWLAQHMAGAGLQAVQRWDPRTASDHGFEDWSIRPLEIDGRSFPVSLNLEGRRPG